MKITQAVEAHELYNYTCQGWTWDGNVHREARQSLYDPGYRDATAAERAAGSYGQVKEPSQIFFGDRLIFIIWREQEDIDREKACNKLIAEAHTAKCEAAEELRKFKQAHEELAKLHEATAAREVRARDDRNTYAARARKLEEDIAKIRNAIGEMKMNEIIAAVKWQCDA